MSRMQAGIILAGQQPNILNTLAQSTRAATLANANRRQNSLNALYQEHGSGLVNGDQNALNALAAQDPRQALQFQQVHQQNERQQRQDALSEQEFAFRIQKWAQSASDAEAAKEAEEYKTLVHMAATAQTPEQWDQIVTQYGGDDGQELVGQFGQRDALLGKYMTAAQIIEQSKPPKPADEYGRYAAEERAAGREPMSRIEFKRAGKLKQNISVGADGSVKISENFDGDDPTDVTSPASPAAMIASIDGVLNDPALDTSTGMLQWTQNIPGTGARRFGARAAQLEGQAFLQAFESLKGAGQITEIEGQKATQAIGRLDTAQSAEDYRQALTELRDILQKGMTRKVDAGKANEAPRLKYNLETGAFE